MTLVVVQHIIIAFASECSKYRRERSELAKTAITNCSTYTRDNSRKTEIFLYGSWVPNMSLTAMIRLGMWQIFEPMYSPESASLDLDSWWTGWIWMGEFLSTRVMRYRSTGLTANRDNLEIGSEKKGRLLDLSLPSHDAVGTGYITDCTPPR
jgi:hypothetical protein